MKTGLSLIEIIIGIALAAIMTVLLYRSLSQTRLTVNRIDQIADYNSVLDKDITSICLITTSTASQEEKGKKTNSLSTTADNIFSFVTTNAFTVYDTQTLRPVRVIYRLKTVENSLSLVRQEGAWQLDLKDFDNIKQFPAYEIMTGLKKFTAHFFIPKDEQHKEWSVYTRWTEEEQASTKRSLPSFIDIEGSWWHRQEEKEYPFHFSFFIPFEEEKKKEDNKTTTTGLSTKSPAAETALPNAIGQVKQPGL